MSRRLGCRSSRRQRLRSRRIACEGRAHSRGGKLSSSNSDVRRIPQQQCPARVASRNRWMARDIRASHFTTCLQFGRAPRTHSQMIGLIIRDFALWGTFPHDVARATRLRSPQGRGDPNRPWRWWKRTGWRFALLAYPIESPEPASTGMPTRTGKSAPQLSSSRCNYRVATAKHAIGAGTSYPNRQAWINCRSRRYVTGATSRSDGCCYILSKRPPATLVTQT